MGFSDFIPKRLARQVQDRLSGAPASKSGFSAFLRAPAPPARPASPAPQAQAQVPRVQASRTQARPAPQRMGAMPDAVRAAFDAAVRKQSSRAVPRPSEAFRSMVATLGPNAGWALDHRGEVLAWLRGQLPHQPPTPMKRGPNRRRVEKAVRWKPGLGQEEGYVTGLPLAAEAFTGAGLFSFACHVEGVYATELCEIEPAAVKTLQINLDDDAEVKDALVWTPSVPDGGLDLLLGGPPCQPFSKGASLGGGEYGTASPKNMYPRILDWVADAQPRVVMMENSDQVATNASYRDYFAWWWKQMAALGYEGVFWRVDASDYGTPQARKRAIAVAWPKGAPWGEALRTKPAPTHGDPGSEAVKSGRLLPWTHAFDRLASGCCGGYGLVGCINLGNLNANCSSCIEGSNFQAAPNQTDKQARTKISPVLLNTYAGMFDEQVSRLEKRRPTPGSQELAFRPRDREDRLVTEWLSPTLTAGGGSQRMQESLVIPQTGTGSVSSIDPHDEKQRKAFVAQLEMLSIREAAKLQDVPQYWQFAGSRKEAWTQIGNGIPINMGRALIRKALDALGYPNPIPRTMAARPFEGLWPMDAVDICARSGSVPQGYMDDIPLEWRLGGEEVVPGPGEWVPRWKASLTSEQRRARPFATIEKARTSRKRSAILKDREIWWENDDGVWFPRWDKIGRDWSPRAADEPPPGFLNLTEFASMIEGSAGDPDMEAVLRKYAALLGVTRDKVEERLWALAGPSEQTWYG